MKLTLVQYGIIAAYFVFVIVKGVRRSKDISTSDDFLLAGRNVGWLMLLCTVGATVVGGGASIGAVGKTYEWGVLMVAVSTGWYLHFIISGLVVAPRFREARVYTVAGYFGHRFGRLPRFAAFLLSLVFSLGVLGAQMVAFGKIIELMIPSVPYEAAVVAGGLFVTTYSTAGGLPAVIHTDFYQFLILLLGFAVTVAFCVPDLAGGASDALAAVPDHFFSVVGDKGWVFLLTTFLAFLLGETFSPAYATRYCIGRDVRQTKIGIAGAGLLLAFTYPAILFVIALYARAHFPGIDPEQALPMTIVRLNNPIVGALVIAALMSAVMSSADSILNSATAIFVKDFYEQYVPGSEASRSLRVSRWCSVGLGALGVALAIGLPNIIDLLLLTYGLWAPGIILPVLVGVLSKTRTKALEHLVFGTMVLSTVATVVFMNTPYAEVVQPCVFGVAFSCVVFVVGLAITRGPGTSARSREA